MEQTDRGFGLIQNVFGKLVKIRLLTYWTGKILFLFSNRKTVNSSQSCLNLEKVENVMENMSQLTTIEIGGNETNCV